MGSCSQQGIGNWDPQSQYVKALLRELKECKAMKDVQRGIRLHTIAIERGVDSDIYVANTLIDMYSKCGCMLNANAVFSKLSHRSVASWNCIIMGYAQNGQHQLAFDLFSCMSTDGWVPNARTFVAALKSCAGMALKDEGGNADGVIKRLCLQRGMYIHSEAVKRNYDSDIFVASAVIDMYVKCGSIASARRVFDCMPLRNVVSWTMMMLGYAETGEGELALQLFTRMQIEGQTPNARAFVAALKACTCLVENDFHKTNQRGMIIHFLATKAGCDLDIFLANSLIDMYAKCGNIEKAWEAFQRIEIRNVVSWNCMIMGYAVSGKGELALQLYSRMRLDGCVPNSRTFVAALKACTSLSAKEEAKELDKEFVKFHCMVIGTEIYLEAEKSGLRSDLYVENTLIDMYAKCGSMSNAREIFDKMLHYDGFSWFCMISGYAKNRKAGIALQLFTRMKSEGYAPDARTFVAVLMACGNVAALESGQSVHAELCSCGFEKDAILSTCLIDFYGKCGHMILAHEIFDSVGKRDIVVWSALITGYSRHGDTNHVFELFQRMKDECLRPDGIIFLSILNACSRAGLVEKGKEFFKAMCIEYEIIPKIEHYTCMVDLLGRANQIEDALSIVNEMPHKPDIVTWKTLLSACRKWTNVSIGRLAFRSLLKLDEKQAPAYVLMANIYGSAGLWEQKSKVQAMRRNVRAWKKPGESCWSDSNGVVHSFMVGDTRHPQNEEIHAKLKQVLVAIKEKGYVVDVENVACDMSDDQKEDALCEHSERLAIACALINTNPGTSIRVVKNLRVCDDCHKATTFISKIEQRTIICRDASRFHVFEDGKCSCGDFW